MRHFLTSLCGECHADISRLTLLRFIHHCSEMCRFARPWIKWCMLSCHTAEVVQVSSRVLRSHFNRQISLTPVGQSASIDVCSVDLFGWSFPATCILCGGRSVKIDSITYFVLEALTCRSCLRCEGSFRTCLGCAHGHCLYTDVSHALDMAHCARCCIIYGYVHVGQQLGHSAIDCIVWSRAID